jgi:hypothetical protein
MFRLFIFVISLLAGSLFLLPEAALAWHFDPSHPTAGHGAPPPGWEQAPYGYATPQYPINYQYPSVAQLQQSQPFQQPFQQPGQQPFQQPFPQPNTGDPRFRPPGTGCVDPANCPPSIYDPVPYPMPTIRPDFPGYPGYYYPPNVPCPPGQEARCIVVPTYGQTGTQPSWWDRFRYWLTGY